MGDFQPSVSNGGISQPGALEILHLAAEEGDMEKIRQLLASHAKEEHYLLLSTERGSLGELPLHSAARNGHLDALFLLLPQSLQEELTNVQTKKGGWSALHLAAISGQTKVVQWLVASRMADVNLQDQEGLTPLHLAVAFGYKEVVRFLVSQGANIYILDKDDMFPFSYCKNSSTFDALLSSSDLLHSPSFNKARAVLSRVVSFPVDTEGRNLLHYAAEYGSDADAIAKLITEAGPDQVSTRDKHGDTFLHVAAKSGNMKVLQAIKKSDPAYIDMEDLLNGTEHDRPVNMSPGMYALFYEHRNFFDELVTLGKVEIKLRCIIQELIAELIDKPEIQPRLALFANTLPTYLALYAKRNCIFDFLLETSFLSLSQWDDEYNRTCLHWAVVDKRIDIVQKLCANVELWPGIQDRDGKTALQHAFEDQNYMVMEILSAKRTFKEHEEKLNTDREVYVEVLHAILVGAALIASVTFVGWLQLPFDAEFESLGMKIYWASNCLSFFTAVATMCVTITALLPTPSQYVGDIVKQLRLAIIVAAGLLALSLAAVMVAFPAAGFAALRHAHIFAYQVIMRSTSALGGCICLIVWLAFLVQLLSLLFVSSRTARWRPTRVPNRCTGMGDSSRFGYLSTKRSELKDLMDEDLVAHRANHELNLITHAQPASKTISLEDMEQLLGKLEISDKKNFVAKIHKQRETKIVNEQENKGALSRIASRFTKVSTCRVALGVSVAG